MKNFSLKRLVLILGMFIVIPIYAFALYKYNGSKVVYTVFTVITHLLLLSGFINKSIFFDAFIGVFFWLGFWLKLSIRVAFNDGIFNESVGMFDGLPTSYDKALIIVIFAFGGLMLAQYLRKLLFLDYKYMSYFSSTTALSKLYFRYRKLVLLVFFISVIFVGLTNYLYVIYQKGHISHSIFPWYINSGYKWLLMFGLSSFLSMFLYMEIKKHGKPNYLTIAMGLFECFISSVSLLSRASIVNSSAIFYGSLLYANLKKIKIRYMYVSILTFSILFMFAFSVYVVNCARADKFNDYSKFTQSRANLVKQITFPLFIDRWVGMEGVMAVSSFQNLGYDLLEEAFAESYDENKPSFYDQMVNSNYLKNDFNRYHHTSMPGLVGFLFYSGSLSFVFTAMLCFGLFASLIEIFAFKFSAGNMIFSSLIGQVVAYRFLNFGYVPNQSYLLLVSILLNILLFYSILKFFTYILQVKKRSL